MTPAPRRPTPALTWPAPFVATRPPLAESVSRSEAHVARRARVLAATATAVALALDCGGGRELLLDVSVAGEGVVRSLLRTGAAQVPRSAPAWRLLRPRDDVDGPPAVTVTAGCVTVDAGSLRPGSSWTRSASGT